MLQDNITLIENKFKRKVMVAVQTGSNTFNLSNAHDNDVLYVIEDGSNEWRHYMRLDKEDFFVVDYHILEKAVRFEFTNMREAIYCVLYTISLFCASRNKSNLLYGELPVGLNLNAHSENRRKAAAIFLEQCRTRKGHCAKTMYWAMALIYALQNNGKWFTAEQLGMIQKCHDRELPVEYVDKFLELNELL